MFGVSVVARSRGRPAAATREEVLAAATARFMDGRRIDFLGLSTELGVSRPTLYRWFGSRDELVGDVLAAAFALMAEAAARRAPRVGLAAAISRLVEDLAASAPLRAFLEQEQASGLRILTSSGGRVQPRTVAWITEIIERETHARRYEPGTGPETLAYAIVRLAEAFLYNDAVAGLRGDVSRLHPIIQRILGEEDSGPRRSV